MKVFLSYSHNDSKFAAELSQELMNKSITVWRDIEQTVAGDLLVSKISQALSECTAYCVLISKDSMSSKWVNLELSAALSRWSNDPSFKFIPVLLDTESLPSILGGMLYISAINESAHHIAEIIFSLISQKNLSSEIASIDWNPLLSAIEKDQFTEPASHSYGGWSQSYHSNFLPLAYPNNPPKSVGLVDSISVTHWVVRGLCSLQRILLRSEGTNSLLNRIERLLNLSSDYLMRHYDGKGAGLIHETTSGLVIHKDIRHSGKFARALLELKYPDREPIRNSIDFSINNFNILGDNRVHTFAEVLQLVGLVQKCPNLRSQFMNEEQLQSLRIQLEDELKKMVVPFVREEINGKLFGHRGQEHMSAYYSWWALDACGDVLLESERPPVRNLFNEILDTLKILMMENPDGTFGYPLTLIGISDLGATAQIGEIMLRFRPADKDNKMDKLSAFILKMISEENLRNYNHYESLCAVPYFIERLQSINEQKIE